MPGALQNRTKPALFSRHLTPWRCFLTQISEGLLLCHTQRWSSVPCAHPPPLRGSAKLNISIKTGVSAELANNSKPFTR